MAEYLVTWAVEVDASDPTDAVQQAWGMMSDAVRSAPEGASCLGVEQVGRPCRGWVFEMQADGSPFLIEQTAW